MLSKDYSVVAATKNRIKHSIYAGFLLNNVHLHLKTISFKLSIIFTMNIISACFSVVMSSLADEIQATMDNTAAFYLHKI